jgi:hypothetical protein
MNDEMMFEYLLQMGAMRPEQEELRRRQAQIDALRQSSLDPLQGQMVGKHYVAPSILGAAGKVAQGYMAGKQQGGMDQSLRDMNERQRRALEEMRRRRMGGGMGPGMSPAADPYGNVPTYGSEA